MSEDSSSAAWLRQARSYLRHDDPVLARLIDDRPDFDPATAHFRLAGHPVVRWYEPGEDWYWCYLDRLVFELEVPRRHRRTCDGSGCTDVDV